MGTLAEGGYKTKASARQWRNEQHTHTQRRANCILSLMEDHGNITFPWGSIVK